MNYELLIMLESYELRVMSYESGNLNTNKPK
jgi:hypothetical protein